MAWTLLHLFIGITVVTATTYKCKHSAYSSSDHEPSYQYDFGNQDNRGLPVPRTFDRISSEILNPSYSQQEGLNAKLRREEPMQATEHEAKVLSWKPRVSIERRRGDATDSTRIVFPGPTSEPFQLEIPEQCVKLGICETVPNYPEEQAKKVIAQIKELGMFPNDTLDTHEPEITQRLGPAEENIELCNRQEKVVYPKAAVDPMGVWHLVLNLDDNPLQGFKVEICEKDESPCSSIIADLETGYQTRCKQKFTYRKMAVLHNGTRLEKTLKVPSCCACVAKLVNHPLM